MIDRSLKNSFRLCTLSLLLFGIGSTAVAMDDSEHSWKWEDSRARLSYYLDLNRSMYPIEVVGIDLEHGIYPDGKVRVRNGDGVVCEFSAHAHTPFLIVNNTIYYAQYSPFASGCRIVSFDLAEGKAKWETRLIGLGPIEHSKYRNAIALECKGQELIVFGQESGGNYLEVLDISSGRTLQNRIVGKE